MRKALTTMSAMATSWPSCAAESVPAAGLETNWSRRSLARLVASLSLSVAAVYCVLSSPVARITELRASSRSVVNCCSSLSVSPTWNTET